MATYARAMLTDEDLTAMSGRSSPRGQRRWLDTNGVRYFLDQDGRPRTTWGAIDAVLVSDTQHAETGVDLSAVQ